MDGSDILRLEVQNFQGPANWDWELKDAAGLHLAGHIVRLDPESLEYQAMTQLPVHVRWEANPERLLESQAEFLGRVGRWMGEHVFGDVGRALVDQSPAAALVVVPPDAGVLRHWPFELAWVGRKPLALREVSLVIDVASRGAGRRKEPIGKRLRVLAVFSLPAREPLLVLSQQRYELVRSIERVATSKGKSVNLVTVQYGVTRDRLREFLEEGEGWDVIHFSGHGLATHLLLEGADGRADQVPANELLRMLRLARSRLKLLVLSSCDSGAAAAYDTGPGHASPVGDAHDEADDDHAPLPALAVDAARQLDCAVLGMRYRVGDDFSIQLAHHLYDSLLAKENRLPRALQLALPKALGHWPEPGNPALSVATPALFGERAVDLKLVPPEEKKPSFRPGGKMSYFGHQPELFVGRVVPMAVASRALAADDHFSGILFHGPEPTGKTACAVELAYLYKDQFTGLVRHQGPARGAPIAGALIELAETLETQLEEFGPDMKDAVRSQAKLAGFLPRLTRLMEKRAIFILIDGIETLLKPEGGWQDGMWRMVVDAMLDHNRGSRLVLTSRQPPTWRHDRLCVVPVPALSPGEALMLARQLPNLGAILRGHTEVSMDQAVPILADTLAAAGGMPGLIREADKKLTSPSVLGDLPAHVAKRGSDVGATGKREEYLRLVRRWTRGIHRPSNGAVPPGESAADVTSAPVPRRPAEQPPPIPTPSAGDLDGLGEQHIQLLQTSAVASVIAPETQPDRQPGSSPEPAQAKMRKEEVNDRPPVVVEDPHGLDGDQIRLLNDSVAVLRDLLTVAEEVKGTSLLSEREAAAVSARMQSTLNRTEAQFLALKGAVTLLDWPDRKWAAKVITARKKAERGLKAAEPSNRFGASDQHHPWPRESVDELLGLLEQYSGRFTTEH